MPSPSRPIVSGTRATRCSPGTVSFGTPRCMRGRRYRIGPPLHWAAVTHLLLSYGLILLFLVVAGESAGIPLPGETALVAAAILATPQHHHYNIVEVIAVA